jgi:hypothetical protein
MLLGQLKQLYSLTGMVWLVVATTQIVETSLLVVKCRAGWNPQFLGMGPRYK